MRRILVVLCVMLLITLVSCDGRREEHIMEKANLLPVPREFKYNNKDCTGYSYEAEISCNVEEWESSINAFYQYVERSCGLKLKNGNKGIRILREKELDEDAYRIECNNTVNIYASSKEGLNYALSTVLQLIQTKDDKILFPDITVYDKPDSSYRALLVDLARQWHPYEYLYKYVDLCYLYKINRLQFHFTDDQSYTLPSDTYPFLPTENRHYTKEQIRDLVEYANDRGVVLVPEVEVPGHCAQFNMKYPEIFGNNGIICAEEKTFQALEKLFGEVCEMFPYSPYIHMGGDEAAITNWRNCPGCRQYMNDRGLKFIDDLYTDFVARVTDIIFKHGRTPVVWEGFSKKGNDKISKDVIVIAWESYYQNPKDLVEAGFTVVNASWKPLYIVAPSTSWLPEEILAWSKYKWQHWWEKSMAYPDGIDVGKVDNVIGGMVCAWGDVLAGYDSGDKAAKEEFEFIRARIPALAVKTWDEDSDMDSKDFYESYEKLDALLERILVNANN